MTTRTLDLADITADVRCQSRTELDDALVAEYAEQITAGTTFPPLMAIQGDEGTYLYDGFHRYYALKRAGRTSAKVDISPGTLRDAVLNSAGANATHGKRRTSADKRRSAETLLNDSEWSKWSDNEISRRCMISPSTVGTIRRSLSNLDSEERAYTDRHGNITTMNTANIGTRAAVKTPEVDRPSNLPHEVVDAASMDIVESVPSTSITTRPPVFAASNAGLRHFEQQTAEMLKNTDPKILEEVSMMQARVEEVHIYADSVYAAIQCVIQAGQKLKALPPESRVREVLLLDEEVQRNLEIGLNTIGGVVAKLRSYRAQSEAPTLRRVS